MENEYGERMFNFNESDIERLSDQENAHDNVDTGEEEQESYRSQTKSHKSRNKSLKHIAPRCG